MEQKYRYRVYSTNGRSYVRTGYDSPSKMQQWKQGFNKNAKTKHKVAKIERLPLVKARTKRRSNSIFDLRF